MHVSISGSAAGTEDAKNLIERSVMTTAKNRRKLPRSQDLSVEEVEAFYKACDLPDAPDDVDDDDKGFEDDEFYED